MPIAALPQDTARVITSTLALSDASSVIKELIDNALDARADTVSVELAANTLDVIQVKDNGSGIGVEDRQLLCRRGCTSKIRSIEDLASLGGTFLGFRGEALASVTELSSAVTITTRIEGEVVGTALKFGPDGKLLSSLSASHPVGTTVRITEFLWKIPVRKQTALKATAKAIATVRKLLQAYAFARPEVRLSFKVLKAKNEKANWAFAPGKTPDSLSEVASKITGKDVADQCVQNVAQSDGDENSSSRWQLDALVISPASDIRKACNSDQYFSVDRRPVNAERGVMKEMSKTYKQFLRNALTAEEPTPALTKPFLLARISCPSDSYDVNVEPAKNEVLFYNPALVRSLFEKLLRNVYGPLEDQREARLPDRDPVKPSASMLGSFDVLLARRANTAIVLPHENLDYGRQELDAGHSNSSLPGVASSNLVDKFRQSMSGGGGTESIQSQRQVPSGNGKTHVSMYTIEDDDTVATNDTVSTSEQTGSDNEDPNAVDVRNPWSLAKLNVRLAPRNVSRPDATDSSGPGPVSPAKDPSHSPTRVPLGQQSRSPTTSSGGMVPFQNPGPPLRPWGPRSTRRDDASASPPAPDLVQSARASDGLEEWIDVQARPRQQSLHVHRESGVHGQTLVHHSQPLAPRQDPLRSPSKTSSVSGRGAPQQQRLSLPFKTPLKQGRAMQDTALTPPHSNQSPVRHGPGTLGYPHVPVPAQQVSGSPLNASQIELDEILEFERRKKVVAAQQRKQLAAKGNWNQPVSLPSPSSQTSTTRPNGAQMYAEAFSKGFQRPIVPSEAAETLDHFAARFANGDPAQEVLEQQPTPARSNPHHNRYLAAARNLSQPQQEAEPHNHAHPEPPSPPRRRRTSSADLDVAADATPKIPDFDPRAYLIRFREQQAQQDRPEADGLTKTGLKIRRAKTVRLPLESVPADARLHDLAIEMHLPRKVNELRGSFGSLSKTDEYLKSGKVDAVVWSPLSKEVSEWENVIKHLVQTKYRPRVLEGPGGEHTSVSMSSSTDFEFEINLNRALKAFVDGDCN